jgi:IclR family pca regulon transcriptional regulator
MSKPNFSPGAPGSDPVDPRLFIQAVERAFRVLEAFGTHPQPMSLSEIAAATGTDKSGAQRLAYTLRRLGYLRTDPMGRGFLPGILALDRSYDFLRTHELVQRAASPLGELRSAAQERVDLSLLDDIHIVYAMRLQSRRETFHATLVGRRLPIALSSGGRAMMALMDDAAVEDILARCDRRPLTPRTITDIASLRTLVMEARECGFAVALEQALLGEVVLAAAIRDRQGRPIGAVHIAGSLSDWSVEDFRRRMAPLAMETARSLSE